MLFFWLSSLISSRKAWRENRGHQRSLKSNAAIFHLFGAEIQDAFWRALIGWFLHSWTISGFRFLSYRGVFLVLWQKVLCEIAGNPGVKTWWFVQKRTISCFYSDFDCWSHKKTVKSLHFDRWRTLVVHTKQADTHRDERAIAKFSCIFKVYINSRVQIITSSAPVPGIIKVSETCKTFFLC